MSARKTKLGLTTKITLVTAIAMIVFSEITPEATRQVLNVFVGFFPNSLSDTEEDEVFTEILLDDRDVSAKLQEIVELNRKLGFSKFVLDHDNRVVWRSPDLDLCTEEVLEQRPAFFIITVEEEEAAAAWVRYRPLITDRGLVGYAANIWLIPLPDGFEYDHAEILPLSADCTLIQGMIDSDLHLKFRRAEWPGRLVVVGVTLVMALVIGIPVSLLVTRRIRRLARETAASGDALPGPFTVRGGDEIARLAKALNRMRGRIADLMANLTARDERRRQWLAQVSHDIRTPLTSALLSIEQAQAKLSRGETDTASLEEAQHDIRRLGEFADDLFELSRLELDDLKKESVLPNELIASAALSVQAQARRAGIRIESDGEPYLAAIEADGHRLMRACENLLSNAIRYAKDLVTITARSTEKGVEFAVTDDGPGFSDQTGEVDLDRVRQRPDSTGLGLIVVRRVAEAHGGEVSAVNEPVGARVRLVIPRRA